MTAAASFGMGLRSEQERVTHSGEASWHLGAEGRMPQGFRGPWKHRPSTELARGQASVPETITVRADWPHWLLWKRTRCQEHTHFCHWKARCRSRNLRGWLALGWQRLWPEAEITQRETMVRTLTTARSRGPCRDLLTSPAWLRRGSWKN